MEPVRNGNERMGRLEALVELILRDIAELKVDINDLRAQIIAIRTTDFRILAGMIIATSLGLAGMMAKGFGWL